MKLKIRIKFGKYNNLGAIVLGLNHDKIYHLPMNHSVLSWSTISLLEILFQIILTAFISWSFRIQAIKQALWGKRFLDKSIYVKSKNILQSQQPWTQYIPVDVAWGDIAWMLYKEPIDQLSQDVYQFPQLLDWQARSDLWLSDNQLVWASWDSKQDQQEAELQQLTNQLLWAKINGRAVKTKRQLHYYRYKCYFSDSDEKYVELNRGITQAWDLFTRKDIITGMDPRIKIERKWLIDKQNMEQAQKFLQYYPLYMSDPTVKPIERRFFKRKALKLQWFTLREIEEACGWTFDELDAKNQVILLSHNIPVQVWDMDEDHYTYLAIYQSALMTPATKSAILERKMAYIQSWQQQAENQRMMQPQQWMWGMMNMWWNSIVSNGMSKANPWNQVLPR